MIKTSKKLVLGLLLTPILLLVINSLAFSQKSTGDERQSLSIKKKLQQVFHEKVYLHTDRSAYVSGDDIWFKAYLLESKYHLLSKSSGLLTVELMSAKKEVLASKRIKLSQGIGTGDLKIPPLATGNYAIRAYTRYMRNFDEEYFFYKKIKIIDINNKTTHHLAKELVGKNLNNSKAKAKPQQSQFDQISVQFFPEGGNIINSLVNFIAFKAVDSKGKGIDIQGTIVNEQGNQVTRFSTKKFGFGRFVFLPKPKIKYTALVNYQGKQYKFPMPARLPKGYLLKVSRKEDGIKAIVETNSDLGLINSRLVVHLRGIVLADYIFQNKSSVALKIPISALPSGIVHFTLFNAQQLPVCERLAFVENPQDVLKVDIQSTSKRYGLRDKASFQVTVKDFKNTPVSTNFSAAVVKDETEASAPQKMNIQNYLWLNSDLKGYIENPAYYFNPKHKDRKDVLDLLMMTQGWRKFKWQQLLSNKEQKLKYQLQTGFDIVGKVVKYHNQRRGVNSKISLSSMQTLGEEHIQQTSKKGDFLFRNVDILDPTQVILQVKKKRRKKKAHLSKNARVYIKLKPWERAPIGLSIKHLPDYQEKKAQNQSSLRRTKDISTIRQAYGLETETRMLDEVEITASRINNKRPNKAQKVVFDSTAGLTGNQTVFEYMDGRIPGMILRMEPFVIANNFCGYYLTYRSKDEIGYSIDGVSASRCEVHTVRLETVSHVSFFKGSLTIYTFKDAKKIRRPRYGIINFKHPGYDKARTFYVPKYEQPNIKKNKTPDLRRILYWNPLVKTTKEGKAMFDFFTSDEEGRYRLEVEGISKGNILLGSFQFETDNQH